MTKKYSALLGAAFLMATSAIGPGFLTTTALFTSQLMASFGFAILVSIIIDIIVQSNIWQMVALAEKPAQNIVNDYKSGWGNILSVLIIAGGFVFNIGNIAGCGLGLSVLMDLPPYVAVIISAGFAVLVFVFKNAGQAMDYFTRILGTIMILLMAYVAVSSNPPMIETVQKSLLPDKVDTMIIITLVGGTVGGYISFSGAHRLLLGGITGKEMISDVRQSANRAIGIASLMRVLLFLAALGVVSKGVILDDGNPAATVFESAAGTWGLKIFGLVIWAASISSIVGASFTSMSFATHWHSSIKSHFHRYIIGFIVLSLLVYLFFGKPVQILIFAGALNGFILAFALIMMLLATRSKMVSGEYSAYWWYSGLTVGLTLLAFGLWALVL